MCLNPVITMAASRIIARGNPDTRRPGERRAAAVDLALVLLAFAVCMVFVPYLNPRLRAAHGFQAVMALALFQFCAESLVPLSLLAVRREPFSIYGFTRERLRTSLQLGVLLALLYDAGLSVCTGTLLWVPLGRQPALSMALSAGFPLNLLGITVTVAVWGFLEGFFGVYCARKVNLLVGHSGRGWLAPGVFAFAFFNGAVHLLVGQGLAGFATSVASGYAITVIPAVTANAWGGTLVQTLTNAAGSISRSISR
jgi:hypothetical protein